MKKIDVYKNSKYIYSTTQFKTCKEAVENCKSKKEIKIASAPDYKVVFINESDKIKARFSK